jgi:hypothetical protein
MGCWRVGVLVNEPRLRLSWVGYVDLGLSLNRS